MKLRDSAPHQHGNDRLIRLVPGIAAAAPDRTLAHAGTSSSVKHLLERAQQLGLAGTPNSSPPHPSPRHSASLKARLTAELKRRLPTRHDRFGRAGTDRGMRTGQATPELARWRAPAGATPCPAPAAIRRTSQYSQWFPDPAPILQTTLFGPAAVPLRRSGSVSDELALRPRQPRWSGRRCGD
jgi:hypothetical protein